MIGIFFCAFNHINNKKKKQKKEENINQQVTEIPLFSSHSDAAFKLQRVVVRITSTSRPDALICCHVIGRLAPCVNKQLSIWPNKVAVECMDRDKDGRLVCQASVYPAAGFQAIA